MALKSKHDYVFLYQYDPEIKKIWLATKPETTLKYGVCDPEPLKTKRSNDAR